MAKVVLMEGFKEVGSFTHGDICSVHEYIESAKNVGPFDFLVIDNGRLTLFPIKGGVLFAIMRGGNEVSHRVVLGKDILDLDRVDSEDHFLRDALDKATAKLVTEEYYISLWDNGSPTYICPGCFEASLGLSDKYCDECGQRIEWDDDMKYEVKNRGDLKKKKADESLLFTKSKAYGLDWSLVPNPNWGDKDGKMSAKVVKGFLGNSGWTKEQEKKILESWKQEEEKLYTNSKSVDWGKMSELKNIIERANDLVKEIAGIMKDKGNS